MGDLGKLCYKRNNGNLAYKHGGSSLVYKVESGDWTTVTFAWGADGKDLDICAFGMVRLVCRWDMGITHQPRNK